MKKNTRIKLTSPTIKTREDLDFAMAEIRQWTIEKQVVTADREARLKEVDDRYAPEIEHLNNLLSARTEQVKAWADANQDAFEGRRSLETAHGTLGWRMGQWQCDKLTGWIWSRTKKTAKNARVVLDKIKELTAMKDYIRVKEEVDKDAIIADRGVLTADALATIGVKVFQEESFYVDPKVDEVENRQTTAA